MAYLVYLNKEARKNPDGKETSTHSCEAPRALALEINSLGTEPALCYRPTHPSMSFHFFITEEQIKIIIVIKMIMES